ncbi:hypothetical protein [Bacillus sp. NEB1478]|uniref:hypothetical protein n=1 Tax=Bacillus sp. NEB1478 TaxID=3073816 RepID=UPI002873C39D|nr:hypothetical protein [Bacillus sp. NEB1478]WNB93042.1 hypothetical protein RGB74_05050 [Bacillus sp. NEB1478]
MKKLILLMCCAVSLVISACSKDEAKPKDQSAVQAEDGNKKDSSSSTSSQKEEKTAEASANQSEETATNEESDTTNADGEEEKDYLTNDHEFVASELANLTEKQISDKLGQPQKSEDIKFRYSGTSNFVPAVVHYYENEKYAVTFVQGKAARLLYSVADLEIPFDDDEERVKALELAGLPTDAEETTDTDTAYVWNNIGGVYEVKMFAKANLVDYLFITLDEAYK